MSAHSIFSPSASSTWLNCPGSIKLNCGVPPEPPSVYAIHGTVLHYITEECLTKGTSPQKFLGQTIDGVTITQEDIGAVQVCVDTVNNLKSKYPGAEYLSESKVNLSDYGNDGEKYAEVFGTADFQIKDLFSELIIIDYKFGSGVSVKAKQNTQLMIYALAAAGSHLFNYSAVRLIIIQPLDRSGEPAVREWEISPAELMQWADEQLFPAIEAAKSDNPPFNPGEAQCRWCKAQPVCKALANWNLSIAQKEFAAVGQKEQSQSSSVEQPQTHSVETLQSHQLGGRVSQVQQSPKLQQPVKSQSVAQKSQQPIQPPQPEVLTVEQLSHVLNQSKAIENWLKAVHAYALNELKNGREIPGWKLVAGRRSRKWKDDNKVADYFLSNGLLKEDQLYETKILSPAKVEKLLGKEAKKEKQFQSLINVVDGKPSLAKADDKRPALTFNSAKEDFKTVKQKE